MTTFHIILILCTILVNFGCDSKESYRKPIQKYISSDGRTCDRSSAKEFSNVDSLLSDFYSNATYKDSFELNIRLGAFYYFKEEYDLSLHHYSKARDIDSLDAKLNFNISLTYSALGDFDKALEYINLTLDMCGDHWEYLNSKCFILGQLNRCEEAIPYGLEALSNYNENEKVYGNIIICFDELGQKDSVKKYIDIVVAKFNKTPEQADKIKNKYNYH